MARGRDHFSVGLREKKQREKERESQTEKKVIFRGALKLRSHESRASISTLRQDECLTFCQPSELELEISLSPHGLYRP